jgi:hypothetical protein
MPDYPLDTQLDAVNTILRQLGEPPIVSLDDQYPTLDLILPALSEARQALLDDRWWFNWFSDVTLTPDLDGRVFVSSDTLAFFPDDPTRFIWAGDRIRLRDGSDIIGQSVKGTRTVDLSFEQLPIPARRAITYRAAISVYGSDVGQDTVYQTLLGYYNDAYGELTNMHTRQRRFSTRNRKRSQRWLAYLIS